MAQLSLTDLGRSRSIRSRCQRRIARLRPSHATRRAVSCIPRDAPHARAPHLRLKPLCRHCAADGAGAPRANKQTDKKTASSGGERAVRRRMRHRAASHCRAAMSHGILPVASHCRVRSSPDPPGGFGARACAEAACSRLSWPLRSLRAVPSVCSCSASYLPAARGAARWRQGQGRSRAQAACGASMRRARGAGMRTGA